MKSIVWLGDSLDELRRFPTDARRDMGYQLDRVQNGLEPTDAKAMPSIGSGVREIRVHAGGEYRVIYVAKFSDGIYVLHAFVKKSQRTAKRDLELAVDRFAMIVRSRRP